MPSLPQWLCEALTGCRCPDCHRRMTPDDICLYCLKRRRCDGHRPIGIALVFCDSCERYVIIEYAQFVVGDSNRVLPSVNRFGPRDPISLIELNEFRKRLKRTSFRLGTKSWQRFIGHFLPDRYLNYPSPEADELERLGKDEPEAP